MYSLHVVRPVIPSQCCEIKQRFARGRRSKRACVHNSGQRDTVNQKLHLTASVRIPSLCLSIFCYGRDTRECDSGFSVTTSNMCKRQSCSLLVRIFRFFSSSSLLGRLLRYPAATSTRMSPQPVLRPPLPLSLSRSLSLHCACTTDSNTPETTPSNEAECLSLSPDCNDHLQKKQSSGAHLHRGSKLLGK